MPKCAIRCDEMKYVFKTIVLMSLLAFGHVRAETAWLKKVDRNGIQVYQQHVDAKFKLHHTKAVMLISASPAMVFALMNDLSVCDQWVYACIEASKTGEFIQMAFEGPFWFKDRDLVFQTEVNFLQQQQQWLIHLHNWPDHMLNSEYVRVENFKASWLLTPVTDNQLLVTYEFYMDPGIKLNAGVNKYNRVVAYQTLKKMKQILNTPGFKNQLILPEKLKQLQNNHTETK